MSRAAFSRLAATALCALGAACSRQDGAQPPAPPPPQVIVAAVVQRTVPIEEDFVARTEAAQTVEIRSEVGGFLRQIAFREGSVVERGQLLFSIDPDRYAAAVQQAGAALAEARAAQQKARDDVERYRPLAAQRAIPDEQLKTAEAVAQQARAAVQAARAELEQAELELGNTRISAPVRGRIGPSLVKTGSLVLEGTTLLDTLYGIEPMYAIFSASERHYLELRKQLAPGEVPPPLPVRLILSDGSEYEHPGRIAMLEPKIATNTGTLQVRAEFPNPEGLLRPGMFARVRIVVRELPGALLVPARAIQQLQGVQSVFVVRPDGVAESRQVVTGPQIGAAQIVVLAGVSAGEPVIVEGAQRVRPGRPVRADVQTAAARSDASQFSATAQRVREN